jgi:deoxyribonuclease-4
LHLNDSKGKCGSGIDRHEHIGKGEIGIIGMKNFLNHTEFIHIPVILETPKKTEDDDTKNLKTVRHLINI